jgi:F0F1-type ATP synthase membrane subunit c/vacuolar-type H+-ATPase subunit K
VAYGGIGDEPEVGIGVAAALGMGLGAAANRSGSNSGHSHSNGGGGVTRTPSVQRKLVPSVTPSMFTTEGGKAPRA